MKPAVTMDEKPTIVIPTIGQAEPVKRVRTRSRVAVFVAVLVGAIVVTGVTLGSFRLGMNAAADNYQEAWITFKDDENRIVAKERVVVRAAEQEAVFSRPGIVKMVIDYAKNALVMQYYEGHKDDDDLYCFVYNFESGMYGTLEDNEKVLRDGMTNVTVGSDVLAFESTGEAVPLAELSFSAREMCYGSKIVRVVKKEAMERQAREVTVTVCILWGAVCASVTVK